MNYRHLLPALALFLGACGGGGGGDFAPPPGTNIPPIARATAPGSASVDAPVTLDASTSSDANGDRLSFTWTLTDKPAGSAVVLANPATAQAAFIPDLAGDYTATLVVSDGKPNGSSSTTVRITATALNVTGPGQFVEAVHLKTITRAEIASALVEAGDAAFLATPKYAVDAYRLTYVTVDGAGRQVAASGFIGIPRKPANAVSPVLSYQHATIQEQAEAPSRLHDLGEPEVVLASLGYIVVAADYVGYGVSAPLPHPYMMSAPSAASVIDFLTAAKFWRQAVLRVPDNRQLFMTGYSEGGYVTVATHRALQAGASPHRDELVRVIAGGGPYDVGVTMDRALAIIRQEYFPLGHLLDPGFLRLLGETDRRHARELLLFLLVGGDTDVNFAPTVFDHFLSDDRAALDTHSSVIDWAPQVPLDLFHGRDDRTVPFASATSAVQAMRARGAGSMVSLTECVAQPAGHSECVLPYWRFVLDRFGREAKDL